MGTGGIEGSWRFTLADPLATAMSAVVARYWLPVQVPALNWLGSSHREITVALPDASNSGTSPAEPVTLMSWVPSEVATGLPVPSQASGIAAEVSGWMAATPGPNAATALILNEARVPPPNASDTSDVAGLPDPSSSSKLGRWGIAVVGVRLAF